MLDELAFTEEPVESFLSHLNARGTGYYLLEGTLTKINEFTAKESLSQHHVIISHNPSPIEESMILSQLQSMPFPSLHSRLAFL